MQRKLLTISYLGTNYVGWQVQPNGVSVQQKIGEAMKILYGTTVSVTGCSRTDSGVHATNYCLHFDDIKGLNNENIIKALNMYLPYDISVKNCVDVSSDFHARYSVKTKTYIYKVYEGERNPFLEGRAYRFNYSKPIDIDKINTFAKGIIGKHDFTSFCASKTEVADKVRTVYEASAYKDEDGVNCFKFTANGFLYNMVRILSGTFIDVGIGKIDENSAQEILNQKNRESAGPTLPPYGLYLSEVKY